MKKINKLSLFFCVLICAAHTSVSAGQSIRVLVNDSPISAYDIDQRTNLTLMSSQDLVTNLRTVLKSKRTQERFRDFARARKPKSKADFISLQKIFVQRLQREVRGRYKPKLHKKVVDELINEKLMIQEAKKLNIDVTKERVNDHLTRMANRNNGKSKNKTSLKAFFAQLSRRGVQEGTMRNRIRASIAWQQVIRRKFRHDVNIGARDIDKELGFNPQDGTDQKVQINLKKVQLQLSEPNNQKLIAKHLTNADKIRHRFTSCNNLNRLLAPYQNATVIHVGLKTIDQLSPPHNIILSDAKAGQMTPPNFTSNGIEMYAVCDKKTIRMTDKKRDEMRSKMRQKGFQMRAARYLRDLRQDAFIEYK